MNRDNVRGFTLVELLVAIAIIAILSAMSIVSLNAERNKARNVAFQAVAKAVQSAAVVCCDGDSSDDASLENTVGGNVCIPTMNNVYPGGDNLGSIAILRNCDDQAGFNIRLTPGTSNIATIDHADCDKNGCQYF